MDRRKLRIALSSSALALAALGAGAVAATGQGTKPKPKAPGYRLVRSLPVGDVQTPSALAIDGAAGRIYVARAVDVVVLESASGKEVATLPCPESRHALALAPELKLAFLSHALTSSVTGFDLVRGEPLYDAKTGEMPATVVYDASLKRVATVDAKGCDVTVVDAASGNVLGSAPLGGPPGEAAGDGKGRLFVTDAQKNEVVAVDLKKIAVEKRWPLAPVRLGHGIAIDPSSRRLFLGTDDEQLAVASVESCKVVATVNLRREVHAIVFDAATSTVLATSGDRSLSVVHEDSPDKFTIVENAATEPEVKLLALDAKTREVALVAWKAGPAAQQGDVAVPTVEPDSLKIHVYGK